MSDILLPQASLFLGIIPAMILLYISLKGFEGLFKEKNIFLSFIAGIIIGVLSAILEYLSVGILLLYVVLFPLIEQLFKAMVLNIRRLQEKQATVIYGLSLGLGFGAVFIPVSLIITQAPSSDPAVLITIMIGSLGILLFHGASGVIIGYGIFVNKVWTYLFYAILLQLPITGTIAFTTFIEQSQFQIALIGYGILVYWFATKTYLKRIIQQSEKRKRRKIKQGE